MEFRQDGILEEKPPEEAENERGGAEYREGARPLDRGEGGHKKKGKESGKSMARVRPFAFLIRLPVAIMLVVATHHEEMHEGAGENDEEGNGFENGLPLKSVCESHDRNDSHEETDEKPFIGEAGHGVRRERIK